MDKRRVTRGKLSVLLSAIEAWQAVYQLNIKYDQDKFGAFFFQTQKSAMSFS